MSKTAILIIIAIIIIVGLGAGAYWYFTRLSQTACTQEAKQCSDGSYVGRTGPKCEFAACPTEPGAAIDCNSAKKFVSDELGIAFCYPEKLGERTVIVEQKGNKVYVDGISGQSVGVFQKDASDTLEQAIEKTFLKNYSKDKCFVENSYTKPDFPASYVFAPAIAYPRKSTDDPYWSGFANCPKGYTQANGVSYFMADKNHFDKFLYFSIGQYGIPIDPANPGGKAWEDTIRFIASPTAD